MRNAECKWEVRAQVRSKRHDGRAIHSALRTPHAAFVLRHAAAPFARRLARATLTSTPVATSETNRLERP